jgi:hypothetical protein
MSHESCSETTVRSAAARDRSRSNASPEHEQVRQPDAKTGRENDSANDRASRDRLVLCRASRDPRGPSLLEGVSVRSMRCNNTSHSGMMAVSSRSDCSLVHSIERDGDDTVLYRYT